MPETSVENPPAGETEEPEEEAVGELEEETEEAPAEGRTASEAPQADAGGRVAGERHDPIRVIEAALFLANKPLNIAELALLAKITVKRALQLTEELKKELDDRKSAIEVVIENGEVSLEVRPEYLAPVAGLSKSTGLTRKSTRILGLIAKKGELLQSELKNYFRGEIYAYVTELKEAGYLTSERKGNTRLLKPTKKFEEEFQLSG